MKKWFAVFLCVVCFMNANVFTGFAEGSSGYQQAYLAMQEEFERGNYADAYTAARIVYEEAPMYQDIVNFYHYLTALQVYLPEKQYKEAYDIFQSLALRKFQKSEGYAAYAMGCQYEADGDYTEALDQFNAAFTNGIDEAYQKIQDCRRKSNEDKYNQAMALQRQKSYLAAAEIFGALANDYPDARQKEKECRYYAAEEYSRNGKYEEAANMFTGLGDYKDSAQKAIQNRAWASGGNNGNKLGLRLEDSTSTSLTLKWDDETALGTFTVAYMPAGIESQMITSTQNDTRIKLEKLLPNTQYTVSVSSPSNTSYFEKNNYWTNQAPPITDYHIRSVTIIPYQLDRASVRSFGVDAVISAGSNSDRCIELSNVGLRAPDRKPSETNYDTYVLVRFFADEFASPKQAEATYVLRLDGKISVGKKEIINLPEKGYKIISANITDLMDVLYENTKIIGSDLTVDVYLDNQHMGTKIISMNK